ncbi:MFS transporter [Bifidobacterium italicum]|nr:hypothetical protein [Bifidobacterium italicum]
MPTDLGLRLAIYDSNLEAARSNPKLSPETGKPISMLTKSRYAVGFLVFGLLWMSGLGIVSAVLLPEHLKSVPGMAPEALVGIINSCTAVASLVSNLMFGLNCMLAPMEAIISDRIPAGVRGTMSAFYGAGSTCGAPIVIASVLFAIGIAMPWLMPSATGKDLGILNLATTLGQMLGPVLMSAITLSLGYAFAFPIAIAFALLGCVFIMLIRGVR